MFCTQCGTEIDQGKNFCKNCGARVGGSGQPVADRSTSPSVVDMSPAAAAQPPGKTRAAEPEAYPAPRGGASNSKLIVTAVAVGFIVLVGAGVYFGTDLLKPTATPPAPSTPEPLAKAMEPSPLPSFEETKDANSSGTSGQATDLPQAPEPAPLEQPKPPAEIKPATKIDSPPPVKAQSQRTAPENPPAGRVTRPSAVAPVSRAGATPGIYETLRSTTVYEDPSASSRVLANIPAGTRVNVVSSSGEWLEVHSKRGNPPGFIRRNDAAFVESSN